MAAIVAATVFCVKLQFNLNEVKADLEDYQSNAQHYRDKHNEHDIVEEHRFTVLETDVQWLKRRKE